MEWFTWPKAFVTWLRRASALTAKRPCYTFTLLACNLGLVPRGVLLFCRCNCGCVGAMVVVVVVVVVVGRAVGVCPVMRAEHREEHNNSEGSDYQEQYRCCPFPFSCAPEKLLLRRRVDVGGGFRPLRLEVRPLPPTRGVEDVIRRQHGQHCVALCWSLPTNNSLFLSNSFRKLSFFNVACAPRGDSVIFQKKIGYPGTFYSSTSE